MIAAAPVDVLDRCAAAADARTGVKQIAELCPQLEESLASLGLEQLLFDGWRDRLNGFALRDLSNLSRRYGKPQRQAAPALASLQPILQSLRPQAQSSKTWWQRAHEWFSSWVDGDSALAKWLKQWLQRLDLSERALDGALYALAGLIIIAAMIVVVRELRLSGIARRRLGGDPAALDAEGSWTASNVEQSELLGVRGLLQALTDRLQATGRLAWLPSMTHRELVSKSRFDHEEQHDIFAALAKKAELIVYGPAVAAVDESSEVASQGRALLAQLSESKEAR